MSRWLKSMVQVGVVATGLTACACFAAGTLMNPGDGDEAQEQSWKREQKIDAKADVRTKIQQKAEARADQRQARLDSMNWYGMSASRPAGAPTPFMSRYGSAWEMPGGRPYSWYPPYTYTHPSTVCYGYGRPWW